MPLVTLCTPTFNRRPFFAAAMACVASQTYPRHRMEWLVVDDGTDPVGDLFADAAAGDGELPPVRYEYTGPGKMTLGEKRNYMNSLARGQILVYWDDDDYYPPTRVAHAVDMLLRNPGYRIAGTKSIHVHYAERGPTVYRYGPYAGRPEYASAATFAFYRDYSRRFDGGASLAEEDAFTGGFSEPMLALDPVQTILVCAHDQNSYDKHWAVDAAQYNGQFGPTELALEAFFRPASAADWALVGGAPPAAEAAEARCAELRAFFTRDVHVLLASYADGSVANKPDVVSTLQALDQVPAALATELAARAAAVEKTAATTTDEPPPADDEPAAKTTDGKQPDAYHLYLTQSDGASVALTAAQAVEMVRSLQGKLAFAERERTMLAAERDKMADQMEEWKQKCMRLRAAAPSSSSSLVLSPSSAKDSCSSSSSSSNDGAAAPDSKKRKFRAEQYERCIAELVCEAREIV